MSTIVQLTESKYNSILKQSRLTTHEIEKKAFEMYEEKGTFGIKITLSINDDYDDNFTLKSNAYVKDWGGKYPIDDEDKKKIVEFVQWKSRELFERSFGKHLLNINNARKKYKQVKRLKTQLIVFTMLGWFISALFLLVILTKLPE